jgi:hypothetical protein
MATYTFFGTTDPPSFGGAAVTGDATDYTFGVAFEVLVEGKGKAVRFYFPKNAGTTMTWPVKVGIWERSSGKLIGEGASALTKEPGASQWVEAAITVPPTLVPGDVYVVGYLHDRLTGGAGYWAQPGYFAKAAEVPGIMIAPKGGSVPGGNGRFKVGSALAMPSEQFEETNYAVDVVFEVEGEEEAEPVEHDDAGSCAIQLSGFGADAALAEDARVGYITLTGSGGDEFRSSSEDSGTAIVALVGTGSETFGGSDAGSVALIFGITGTDALEADDAADGALALIGTGIDSWHVVTAELPPVDRPTSLVLAGHAPSLTLADRVPTMVLADHAPSLILAPHDPEVILDG